MGSVEGNLEEYILDGEGETRDVELGAGGKVVAEQLGVQCGGHEDNAEIQTPVDSPDSSNGLRSAADQAHHDAGTLPVKSSRRESEAACLGRRSLRMMRRKSSFMPLGHGSWQQECSQHIRIRDGGTFTTSGRSRVGEAGTERQCFGDVLARKAFNLSWISSTTM